MQRSNARGSRWVAVLFAAAVLGMVAGVGLTPSRVAHADGPLNFRVAILVPNALTYNPALCGLGVGQIDCSGITFSISGPTLAAISVGPTGPNGTVSSPSLLTTGNPYTLGQSGRPDLTFVGFVANCLAGPPAANPPIQAQFLAPPPPANADICALYQVSGLGRVQIQKQVTNADGSLASNPTLSGYSFQLTGGPGNVNLTRTTDTGGVATFFGLADGSYTLRETAVTGFSLFSLAVNNQGVANPQNGATITIAGGNTVQVVAQNRPTSTPTTGNVSITKNIVDANGAFLPAGDRSQFNFTFGSGATSTTAGPTNTSGAATANLAAGSYVFNETARSGCTFRNATFNGNTLNQGDTIAITAAGPNAIIVNNTCTGTTPGGQTRVDQLFPGCNNVAITSPAGTPLTTVAAGVSPASSLNSIFRYNNATGTFSGFNPSAPTFANDYNSVGVRFEPVFVCVTSAGQFTQPAA